VGCIACFLRFAVLISAKNETMSASAPMNLVIACGGTGGHLFPGIAVAEEFIAAGHRVLLLISEKRVDAEASAKYPHLRFATMPSIAKPSTFSPKMLVFIWKTWLSIRSSRRILREFNADAVLGMGGFTSLPPILAARWRGIPSWIHDSNARPGRANVMTSRYCTQVMLGMQAAAAYFPRTETVLTGTPLRPEILRQPTRHEAATIFGLQADCPTVLVTGGSQGAQRLNELCAQAAGLLNGEVQFLQIAGSADFARISAMAEGRSYHRVIGFCDQMAAAYALADLVIARAGASSLTEIGALGKVSILVPYPYAADDHQTANAKVFADAGAAVMAAESDLSASHLSKLIRELLQDSERCKKMAAAARELTPANAAARVRMTLESGVSSSNHE
jgi:UDP-N-acetylglucosamine--N-acetylmuramyl-(pentapeptide) pyrophosphoryl-undecaprenol N-acetylglucosamine transferase